MVEFPDLRNPDPERGNKIDRSNVVMDDMIKALVEVDKWITRFEVTAESRNGWITNHRLDDLIELCNHMKRRINDIRREINVEYRGGEY